MSTRRSSRKALEYLVVAFKARRLQVFVNEGPDPVSLGTMVVVSVDRGTDMGRVLAKHADAEDLPRDPEGRLLRVAGEEDLARHRANIDFENEVMEYCSRRVKARNLQMRLTGCEIQLDRNRIRVFFTADKRTDFRGLVRDLAARFKARIEMRQIGVRDHAKRVGGVGICGRRLCCASFMNCFSSITLKSVRVQNLTPNPAKVSGLCSRLMCCLDYELDFYRKAAKTFPRIGGKVMVDGRRGVVKSVSIFSDKVKVGFEKGDDEYMDIREFHSRRGRGSGGKGRRGKRRRNGRRRKK
jgi:cell fate regulator YaaT (PSP1 superfamily)